MVGEVEGSARRLIVWSLIGVSRALDSNFSSMSQLLIKIYIESCQRFSQQGGSILTLKGQDALSKGENCISKRVKG